MKPKSLLLYLFLVIFATFSVSKKAYCILEQDLNSGISGYVTFDQPDENKKTTIHAKVKGFKPGTAHGFHIHEKSDYSDGCKSTGPHYNPTSKEHGPPFEENRHVGDMGNLRAQASPDAEILYQDDVITLYGKYSILNRACMVHEKEDDLGKGGAPDSKTTGNAGGRIACGTVIEGPLPEKYLVKESKFLWKFLAFIVGFGLIFILCFRANRRYKRLEETS